jgi:hypothetical protein
MNEQTNQKITIRNSVPRGLVDQIPTLIQKAVSWLQAKYPSVDFTTTEYIFSGNYTRSRYYRNEVECGKYLAPNTCISTTDCLRLYNKKSLNVSKKAIRGFTINREVNILCSLVHELTHHAQYELNLNRGELETTKNELEYLKEFHPDIYNKCIKPEKKTYLEKFLEKHSQNIKDSSCQATSNPVE